jgi:hypothetical protein
LSALEDPVTTLLRLITTRIRIIKDNASVANILATRENYDRELLKNYDAQITLALDSSQDQKLELSGRLRRRHMVFRCNCYSVDKSAPGADLGVVMRDKLIAQINAIIRENRSLPYQTICNFYELGYPSGDPHKAYSASSASELAPSNAFWTELSTEEYQGIWSSDDGRFSKSTSVAGQSAMMLFRFKIAAQEATVKQLVLSFEGYGVSPGGNGVTIKLWNHVASAWQQTQSGTSGEDETLTITISSYWTDFIDSEGYVWVLAKTANSSDGNDPTVLNCDFVQCTFQVYGLTYVDVVSYRNIDVLDVKPFLFRCEFLLKGWLFESISN